MLWKASGEGKTTDMDSEYALEKLLEGIRSENTCFIYHAHDHYFCPIGYGNFISSLVIKYKRKKEDFIFTYFLVLI